MMPGMEGALQALNLSPGSPDSKTRSHGFGNLPLSPGSRKWPLPPNDGEDITETIIESSSKLRRGVTGRAISLDEENNPSPTRLQRRSPEPTFEPFGFSNKEGVNFEPIQIWLETEDDDDAA